MHIRKQSFIYSIIIIGFLLIVSGFIFAVPLHAQESTIIFPVGELGDCDSKENCRSYCDEPGHMKECITFAKAHNLMTPDEAEVAEKFSDTLEKQGGGPGGCTTPSRCESYCENVTHLRECLSFAEDNGHHDKFVEEGKRIAQFLDDGGQMPGGCTSKQSCKSYCSDFNHAEECVSFAERAGLETHDDEHEQGPNLEQVRTMIELTKRGETPGGCTSKQSCESYCSDSAHSEECISFGEKVGFISHEKAEMARKTGGKGPGSCTSREECNTFCNNPSNREQCFAFAEEHGLINEDERHNLEEGANRLKEVLVEAPDEARECLKHNLGKNIITDIQNGSISPGPEFARKVEACIHKGFEEEGKREFGDMMNGMPPEVRACIEEKVGGDIKTAFTKGGGSDLEHVVKGCFESFRPEGDVFKGGFDDNFDTSVFHQEEGPRVFHNDRSGSNQGQIFDSSSRGEFGTAGFGNFPPEMEKCALDKFGGNFKERLASGELNPEDFKRSTEGCVRGQFQGRTQDGVQHEFNNDFGDRDAAGNFNREVPIGDFIDDFQKDFNSDDFNQDSSRHPIDEFKPFPPPTDGFRDEFNEPHFEPFNEDTRDSQTFDGSTQFEEFKEEFNINDTSSFDEAGVPLPPPPQQEEGSTVQ
ncbi:hypothetical protein HQ403_03240 [Candidatus Kaiserbacteria bacterium]|nr:hypothetical protein [Candidatus Kaiserbacteria bacterium]